VFVFERKSKKEQHSSKGATTFNTTTFTIMTLSVMLNCVSQQSIYIISHDTFLLSCCVWLFILCCNADGQNTKCRYADCRSAECCHAGCSCDAGYHFAESWVLLYCDLILIVIMLGVVMFCVVVLIVVLLCAVMLSVVMLCVVMLSVIIHAIVNCHIAVTLYKTPLSRMSSCRVSWLLSKVNN
jgi:hypothetical protein